MQKNKNYLYIVKKQINTDMSLATTFYSEIHIAITEIYVFELYFFAILKESLVPLCTSKTKHTCFNYSS